MEFCPETPHGQDPLFGPRPRDEESRVLFISLILEEVSPSYEKPQSYCVQVT